MTVSVDRDELVAAGYFVTFDESFEWAWGISEPDHEIFGDGYAAVDAAWTDAAEHFASNRPGWDD